MSFRNNEQNSRFELEEQGHVAFANYKMEDATLFINYVEAPVELRGTGAAGRLMEKIVETARKENYKIFPICGYAASWLRRHKEVQDLLK